MSLDELPFSQPEPDATRPERPPRRHRHEWMSGWTNGNNFAVGQPAVGEVPAVGCIRCWRLRDDLAARRGRNNRARGGRAELAIAREYGGSKIGPLGGPADVVGTLYATQAKTHVGLPPAWYSAVPAIRVVSPSLTPYVWVCTDVLGGGHLAIGPARWDGIFKALEPVGQTPRLIERWTRQGVRPTDWVVVRRQDEPSDPERYFGRYVAWTGTDWLDRYGKDD